MKPGYLLPVFFLSLFLFSACSQTKVVQSGEYSSGQISHISEAERLKASDASTWQLQVDSDDVYFAEEGWPDSANERERQRREKKRQIQSLKTTGEILLLTLGSVFYLITL